MSTGIFDDAGWTHRYALAGKHLVYAFSLDVHFHLAVPDARQLRVKLSAIRASECSTYHIGDDTLARGADGALHEVPLVRIVSGEDWITFGETGVGEVDGALIAELMDGDGEVRFNYHGVVALPRGFERLRSEGKPSCVPGTAFISTRHVCSHPKYQWLESQALFGFGQVLIDHEPLRCDTAVEGRSACHLKLSFDLYSGV